MEKECHWLESSRKKKDSWEGKHLIPGHRLWSFAASLTSLTLLRWDICAAGSSAASQPQRPGFDPDCRCSVCFPCDLLGLAQCSGSLPHPKDAMSDELATIVED